MSFHLISSNKVEALMAQLAVFLKANPLDDPLVPETVVVPSMPMKRWLGLQIAQANGINCNIDYPLPASWLWKLVSTGLHDTGREDPLSRERAAWLIFERLPRLLHQQAFQPLQAYLRHDNEAIKRWQLSRRIADVFDRYQYYRPDMIRNWCAGGGSDWQALLWRDLTTRADTKHHRVALMDAWLQRFQAGQRLELPERVSMFCVSSLPPLLLRLFQYMSERADVCVYYLTPTDKYWADLKSARDMARRRLAQPDEAIYFEQGHELLTSWGRQGQIFQDMLLNDDALQTLEGDLYQQQWPDTLLGRLQHDLFMTRSTKRQHGRADDSIAIHACHSPMRECQVLHDALLQRMHLDDTLQPEDILVMVPEISRYAPYIEAVFGKDDARPTIPWNLSETSMADEEPLLLGFLQLLNLPSSRFALSDILSLLDIEEIRYRFEIDGDQATQIRTLLENLHVRWGVDGEHRKAMGLPANIENSWEQAKQRFLAGYAMGNAPLWQGIAPMAVDAAEAALLARFWRLFERLNYWRLHLQKPRSAAAWQTDLLQMLDDIFRDTGHEHHRLQQIRDVLVEFSEQAGKIEISLALLQQWLQAQLAECDAVNHYFSRGVSFCGMRPMRSLPFRVICLLGMHDAAFPGREHPLEFDKMAGHWQPGDPVKREMDRYLMLETLLCARDTLYISYVGRNIRDDSVCQPSVLVQQIMDELTAVYGEKITDKMVHIHPMQAFSLANYTSFKCYDKSWYDMAIRGTQAETGQVSSWPAQPLAHHDAVAQISLTRLIQFVKHPVKFFVNHTLGIYLGEDEDLCDDEPFALDFLQQWQIRDRLLNGHVSDPAGDRERMKAEGILPHGAFADVALDDQAATVEPILSVANTLRSTQAQPRWIELSCPVEELGQVMIHGQISEYYPGQGLLRVSPSTLKGKHIVAVWIQHLALCATALLAANERSVYVCRKKNGKEDSAETISFAHMDQASAMAHISVYLDAYMQGINCPLAIFPESSWAYASAKDVEKATIAASKAWGNSRAYAADKDDEYIQLMMRDVLEPPLEQRDFQRWASRFYQSMQDHWSRS